MNPVLKTLPILLLLTVYINSSTVGDVVCTTCRCYELKCSRLETPDESCVNKYRNSCDNNEDITEANFCNIQCDCCLEQQCKKWDEYSCIMFRTYEFSNIVYFILLTVHAFVLIRVYKAMFSKEEEIKTEENEEEEENLKQFKTHTAERFVCPYSGRLAIKTDSKTTGKVPEERVDLVRKFFANIAQYEPIAKKNLVVLIILISIYVIINIFHICNIFVLGNLPLTYVKVVWLQHTFLALFWIGVIMTFKRLPLYSGKVKEVVQQFETQEKCKITMHNNLNIVEFNFKDS